MWLLIMCAYIGGSCDYRGGVTAISVPEAQCRAAIVAVDRNLMAWCISPTGELAKKQPK